MVTCKPLKNRGFLWFGRVKGLGENRFQNVPEGSNFDFQSGIDK